MMRSHSSTANESVMLEFWIVSELDVDGRNVLQNELIVSEHLPRLKVYIHKYIQSNIHTHIYKQTAIYIVYRKCARFS